MAEVFFENSISPPPRKSSLKSLMDPPLTPFLLCTVNDQQTDTPQKHSALRMKMRLNQDVRGDAKSAPVATPMAYTEAMFTLYRIVKRSVAESVPDRASVHTRNAGSGTVLLHSAVESGTLG